MSRLILRLASALTLTCLLTLAPGARADELPEYRLKAAFVYNFIVYAEWPAETGGTLNLCLQGADPFGKEIDGLQGKAAGGRQIAVHRRAANESLKDCQIIYFSPTLAARLPQLLETLRGQVVLTIADSPGAARQGVALNMGVVQSKISFEANLLAARGAGLNLSSKLLRLATEVLQ